MSASPIHVFNHNAMATYFQVRIAGEEPGYAAQAAQAAFAKTDHLEGLLSRFRENSEISQIAQLTPGGKLRLTEPTFACLTIAERMERATRQAFSVAPTAVKNQAALPKWSLLPKEFSIRCEAGRLEFDLGAIGKGFALDRMAEELAEWDCPAFMLVAGGSSVLVGASPPETPGWSSGLSDDGANKRYWLSHCSLSGSGLAVKGNHILDPRTGNAAAQRPRAWALTSTAAESDALSTACMVLNESEIEECLTDHPEWLVFLNQEGQWRHFGKRALPNEDLTQQPAT